MSTTSERQNMLIGFLSLYETLFHDGYLGALLLTDLKGIPQEFRCTHPVKPTTIQKPLYGNALEPYIGVNLCGIPLIKSLQNKPLIIAVNKDFLLGVRVESPYPVIFVRRAGEAIEIKPSDASETIPKGERIDSSTGRFQPIVCVPHPNYIDDQMLVREILEEIFSYFDLLEPFERMAKAIEILCKQDKRFQ